MIQHRFFPFARRRLQLVGIMADICNLGRFFSFWTIFTIVRGYNMDLNAPVVQSISDTTSYFGFAVTMHRHNAENMVIVGAPRFQTSETDVNRGGALFRCPVSPFTNPASCQQLSDFDTIGSEVNEVGTRIANKSGQWFGASVKSSGENGNILACRPLYQWFIQPEGASKEGREPIGGCFIANSDFSNIRLYEPCRSRIESEQSVFGISQCEAGFAADISGDEILLGAPGSYFWQGQIWVANTNLQTLRRTNEGPVRFDDSYRGYAVAFGDFRGDSRPEYAVGIPRAVVFDRLVGMVSIFDSTTNAYLNLTGTQTGAYFGHTLVVDDFNDDSRNDLAVSAPFYIDESKTINGWEIGHVRIFYNDGNGGFSEGVSILGRTVRGRFGYSMAALNDVNQDGYNDLAVGAPYDGANGQGMVYIYHSLGQRGLSTTPSQTLAPSDFGLSLQTFGASLAAGMDMDNNAYPDLVVGAYKSSTVVVVRSRPVVRVTGSVVSQVESLDLKNKNLLLQSGTTAIQVASFNLTVCIEYTGTNAPPDLDFDYTVVLDYSRQTTRRASFVQEGNDAPVIRETVSLTDDVQFCKTLTAYAKPSIVDKLAPIPVSLTFGLSDTSPAPGEILPIISEASNSFQSISVPILRNCMNQTCVPDLSIQAATGTSTMLVGSSETLTIDVTITNNGEDAYLSILTIAIPKELQYAGFNRVQMDRIITCSNKIESSEITCDVGNPFQAGSTVIIQFQFSSDNLQGNSDDISFRFRVSSVEQERITSDNDFNISIALAISADLSFHGNVIPEKVIYSEMDYLLTRTIGLEKDIGPEVTHVFSLYNNGPSSIGQTEITILWPVRYDRRLPKNYLLYLISAQMDSGEECTIDGPWNPEGIGSEANSTYVSSSNRRRRRATITDRPTVSYTDIPMSTTASPVKVLDIDCSGSQSQHCYTITCMVASLGAGTNAANNAILTVRSRVWTNTLTRNSLELTVFVQAHARVLSTPYVTQYNEIIEVSSNEVSTNIVPQFLVEEIEEKKVALWVYLVSVLSGAIILIILILILWRVGFFKRKKKLTADQRKMLESKNGDVAEYNE